MKIAIVIPSLYSDEKYLRVCEAAIKKLDPPADEVLILRNDGSKGLKEIRSGLFDDAFNKRGCDIALQCSSDFQLFPDILKHISDKEITTFSFVNRRLSMPIQLMKFLLSPGMWTGCYSIPRIFWEGLGNISAKGVFDGNDTSIKKWAGLYGFPIKRVRSPKYRLLRPSEKMLEFIQEKPLHKKIIKLEAWF